MSFISSLSPSSSSGQMPNSTNNSGQNENLRTRVPLKVLENIRILREENYNSIVQSQSIPEWNYSVHSAAFMAGIFGHSTHISLRPNSMRNQNTNPSTISLESPAEDIDSEIFFKLSASLAFNGKDKDLSNANSKTEK